MKPVFTVGEASALRTECAGLPSSSLPSRCTQEHGARLEACRHHTRSTLGYRQPGLVHASSAHAPLTGECLRSCVTSSMCRSPSDIFLINEVHLHSPPQGRDGSRILYLKFLKVLCASEFSIFLLEKISAVHMPQIRSRSSSIPEVRAPLLMQENTDVHMNRYKYRLRVSSGQVLP